MQIPAEFPYILEGETLIVMLDIDGTLCDIAPRPEDAVIPEGTRDLLESLSKSSNTLLALVTGRSAHDAKRLISIDNIYIIGNHGFELMKPGGSVIVSPFYQSFANDMRKAARDLETVTHQYPGAQLEDKLYTLSLHYRLATRDLWNGLERQIRSIAAEHKLSLTEGSCVFELRPPVNVNKGLAAVELVQSVAAETSGTTSVFFAGDDITDEDAFVELNAKYPTSVTVSVGDKVADTKAKYRVRDPDELMGLLSRLAAYRSSGS